MSTGETFVFLAVIGARFLVPLLIPRFPLPAILSCLVLDAADQSIFQAFGYDPPGYQGYDKAMDVYYLALAYLSTLRNWSSVAAYQVGRFLYFYRLVGVVAFELTQVRALLLVFPNTFEYFFMAYEAIRSRWSPVRWALRWWIGVAAFIWVFIKLPQEWWIHVAQLDVTEFLEENAWAGPLVVAVVLVAAGAFWIWGRPRLLPADHPWRFSADPLPAVRGYAERKAVQMAATVEQMVLLGLLSVVFAQTLPGVEASNVQVFIGVAVVVLVNAVFAVIVVRRSRSLESTALAFLARTVANVALVAVAEWLLPRGDGGINVASTLFFLTLISLVTTLHGRWYPVHACRAAETAAR
ncbi:hypothetical protein [Nocardioides sp. W7]|uniref:hypothetical protein n=1 Tax=Nocardioides sp. W7 TaxID=2931390 RepID=UPI001FD04D51|nr:hypothetical protein [Nocardioides sp. W7]